MKEQILQTKILQKLKNTYHVKIIMASTSGHPDIIICKDSKFIAIEVKSDKGVQSELQKYRERQIRDSGGIYILARSMQDVENGLTSAERTA
jgi:hypothetical protein